jgi:fatty-acyl-CoA synthase
MLIGCMQEQPLLISSLLEYAAENHADREIVSKLADGTVHRYGYADAHSRAKRLANALLRMGIGTSDRVGTIASNSFRHFECFYGVSGIGAVLHTINPRLFEEQIKYIINHAEDRIIIVDPLHVALLEKLAGQLPSVERYIILTDEHSMPNTTLPNVLCYETLLAAEDDQLEWPGFDERSASSLCYTSGTTGNPKGVLFSHRSTVLHAMHAAQTSVLGIGPSESILVIAPMYHANAWSIPYVGPMTGAKLVLPGRDMGAENLHDLIISENATFACAVPTVWNTLLQYVEHRQLDLKPLSRAAIAGVTVPPVMIDHLWNRYGISVLQFWGMTEMSPIATISTPIPKLGGLGEAERKAILSKQGRVLFGVKLKIVDEAGKRMPRDGASVGNIFGKGPWVANGYFKAEGGDVLDAEGWLPTGDVGFLDEFGYLKLTDRSKDVIKSGGEWISSVDLENAALTHEAVGEAAVVGVRHPKWDERPLLIITLKAGRSISRSQLMAHLAPHVAKWWLPDDVVVVEQLPYTATGKIKKSELRSQYRDYLVDRDAVS